ncbi:haloacid dehalogenase [Amanita rubescens]|nr:haloacid dehalogenase [Amanita rubescens]
MDLQAQYPDMLYSDLLATAHKEIEKRLKALSEVNNADESDAGPALTSTADASTSTSVGIISDVEDPHTIFAKSIKDWKAFPDSREALRWLADHFELVVLSNVDHESFKYGHARLSEGNDAELTRKKLGLYSFPENNPNNHWFPRSAPDDNKSPFTLVLTAQDVKAYKPSVVGMRTVLRCACSDPRLLGEEGKSPEEIKEKVLVVAQSLLHDHEMAGKLGMASVWIDRQDAVMCKDLPEGTKQKWTWRFETLAQLVEAIKEELCS